MTTTTRVDVLRSTYTQRFSALVCPCLAYPLANITLLLQVENILLDYDETSVIATFDQTTDQKQVFEGVEVRRCPKLRIA